MDLQKRWTDICSSFSLQENVIEEYWEKIQSKYTERHRKHCEVDLYLNSLFKWYLCPGSQSALELRYYHTLNHIADMFKLFDNVISHLSRPELVAMAIFFHDVIYEPKQKDNEEKSARLFLEFAEHFVSTESEVKKDTSLVYDWIIQTKTHKTEVHETQGLFGQDDLHFFLDMDMAILGCPETDYKIYADDIRKEYQHIPEPLFRSGRAKVLRCFLEVPNIYATEIFRTRLENRARENIKAEILRLEG